MSEALLRVENLTASYGNISAVRDVSLKIHDGELRVILGANGAGKSTIIKAIVGLLKSSGTMTFLGVNNLQRCKPHQTHALGIACVPEARQLWQSLSVLDNLRLGGYSISSRSMVEQRIEALMDRFPRLRERRNQAAGSLSGGEQQMVAIARALVSKPRLLLLDEPSLGLAPIIVKDVFRLIKETNAEGVAVLLVEQNAKQALKIADWAYLLEVGSIVDEGSGEEMMQKKSVQDAFLGGHH